MSQMSKKAGNTQFLFRILQGALIGLGAVLPGISGGVLCVIFGVYQPIMEVLANPFKAVKKHIRLLIPIGIGVVVGFLGVAKLLGFLLNRYPNPSVCLFIGLIAGMLPSLYREAGEQGRNRNSFIALGAAFALVLGLLVTLRVISLQIVPNFAWYLFCGFCLALSVIAPGMSFSTLLMPLGLYTPFIDGIGNIDFGVLIPGGIGALLTVILFARAVDSLVKHHYSVTFHAIIGVVIAATLVIIPFASFAAGVGSALVNIVCMAAGVVCALALDKFNSSIEKK
ncbi:MAG: DUF368 domain-containing protein [Clostridia bacterium]|nr:DUF368 domain-containing protein [Clostridia bacterium]